MCLIGKTQLLCMQCRGIGPHLAARGKSHEFSRVVQAPGVYSRVTAAKAITNSGCPAKSGLLSCYDGHLGKLNYAWQENTDASGVSREAKLPLLVGTVILIFLSIFTKSQASSPFEALNSAHLSKSQIYVRTSVQNRLRTMAFSRVSTGDSDIPSSCDMNDEHA